MPRKTASPLLPLATLVAGVLLGLAIDRGGSPVAALATGSPQQGPAPASAPAQAAAPRPKPHGEDAVYQELARQYDQFEHVNRTFELVAKSISPAVVHIVAKKSERRDDGHVSRFDETGSGVIVRADKGGGLFVLTNNHVIEGAATSDIQISLQDGRALRPERAWWDAKADVAVMKLGRDDLPCARLGNSDDLAAGTWVVALGSPFGLTHSVSHGIISARGRHEKELEDDGVENQDFLQTDAAINPGNSGGPLVNMKGEVVGINTAIASNGGGSEGVGFSIPINLARWIMNQLLTVGKVSRGAMGVDLANVEPKQALTLGLERPRGAQVLQVHDGSPAAAGGLRDADVVVRFNGVTVVDLNHLINLVSMAPIGQPVEIVVWRDRQELKKTVTIADREVVLAQSLRVPDRKARDGMLRRPNRPAAPPAAASGVASAVGLDLLTVDGPSAARRLNLPEATRGVAVIKVEPTSPLSGSVLPLDLIATIGGRSVRTADEAARALIRRKDQTPTDLVLNRVVNGTRQKVTVPLP